MAFNPVVLNNLKRIESPEQARKMQLKSAEKRKENRELRDALKATAHQYKQIMADLPEMSPLDVLQMLMINALQNEQFEDASRYANMIAPYKAAKLSSVEQSVTTTIKSLTDDELKAMIQQEGLGTVLPEGEDDVQI